MVMHGGTISNIAQNGVDIGTLRFNLRADGTATVIGRATGNGDLQITFPGTVEHLGMTYRITEIGPAAFIGHQNNVSTQITMIDLSAMQYLVTIGDQAFRHHNLSELILKDLPALTTIGSQAFRNEFIPGSMVSDSNLTEVTLSNLPLLTTIGNSAFLNNVITDLILTDVPALPGINMVAFAGNSLETITVNNLSYKNYFTQLVFQSPAHRRQTTDTVLLFVEPELIAADYNTTERLFLFTPDDGENFTITATAAINVFWAEYPTPPSMSINPLPWEQLLPTFQWYRYGIAIPGQTGTTLNLTNLTAADAGDYHVVVTWNHVDETWQDGGRTVATKTLEVFRLVISNTQPLRVTIEKTTDREQVYVGEQIVYTITITNIGAAVATNVVVTDMLPAGIEFVSTTGADAIFNPTNNTLTVNIAELAIGEVLSFTVMVLAVEAGTATNTAAVTVEGVEHAYDEEMVVIESPGTTDCCCLIVLLLLMMRCRLKKKCCCKDCCKCHCGKNMII